jgi:hypothetical protein
MEEYEQEVEEVEEDEEDGDEDGDEEEEALWAETEALLHTVSALQEEARRRTEGLLHTPSNWVKTCYLASLEDLEKTGEVTFGQHLLQRLRNNN